MSFIGITPVDVDPGSGADWQDADLTSHLGGDAGNVAVAVIRCVSDENSLCRANGSTDAIAGVVNPQSASNTTVGHCDYYVPVDANDIIEVFRDTGAATVEYWLMGYFLDGDADGPTNRWNKSTSTTGSYQDVDISTDTGGDTALAAAGFLYDSDTKNAYNGGVRENGSTDTWNYQEIDDETWKGFCVGCDGSELFEQRIENADVDCYVTAYIINGWVGKTNGVDYSENTTTGSYVSKDVTSDVSADTVGIVVSVETGTGGATAVRDPDHSSWDEYNYIYGGGDFTVGINADQEFEQKIAGTGIDMYLTGYFETAAGATTMVAGAGSYSLVGTAATTLYNKHLDAGGGTYNLTGSVATTIKATSMIAGEGSYAISGQPASLLYNKHLDALSGAYLVSGQVAILLYNRHMDAGIDTYSLNGQQASLIKSTLLDALSGTYSLSGSPAVPLYNRVTQAGVGTYSINGQPASLLHNKQVIAASGAYSLSGSPVDFSTEARLQAGSGTYSINGQPATTTYTPLTPSGGDFRLSRRVRRR